MPDHGAIRDYATRVIVTDLKRKLREAEAGIDRVVQQGIVRIENAALGQDVSFNSVTATTSVTAADLTATDDLSVTDDGSIGGDLTVSGRLKGVPAWFLMSRSTMNTSQYMKMGETTPTTTQCGIYLPYTGSVLGLYCNHQVTAVTGSGTATFQVRINGTSVFSTDRSVSATDASPQNATATQARGTDTFSAGDVLQTYIDLTGFSSITVDRIVFVAEVVFDS